MGKKKKQTVTPIVVTNKRTIYKKENTDICNCIWCYDKIDVNGKFAFNLNREDFDHKGFLEKMINYSSMTWADIKKQTHDRGKSKHHFISIESMSKEARTRLESLQNLNGEDAIFSFAFNNLLRIIGIRNGQFFYVLWYDVNHEVCPRST